jgi:hypothetical protein
LGHYEYEQRVGNRTMHQIRSVVISSVLIGAIVASLVGCGRVAEERDASAVDAAPDQAVEAEICIPDGQKDPTVSVGCCSGHSINDICVATCYDHGSGGCGLPHRPCCSDADTCTIQGCF